MVHEKLERMSVDWELGGESLVYPHLYCEYAVMPPTSMTTHCTRLLDDSDFKLCLSKICPLSGTSISESEHW